MLPTTRRLVVRAVCVRIMARRLMKELMLIVIASDMSKVLIPQQIVAIMQILTACIVVI